MASTPPPGGTRASLRFPCLLGLCAFGAAFAALTGRRAAAPRVAAAAVASFSSEASAYSYSFGDVEQAWDWISEIEASTAVVCPTADCAQWATGC